MRASPMGLDLSASDLSQFLGCVHRTALDLAVTHRLRVAPAWRDPAVEILQERGLEHERKYVDALRTRGAVVDLSDRGGAEAEAVTMALMAAGAPFVVQAALRDGAWFGRPDVLARVERPSVLGPWSYEVVDTKLARETRAGTVLQLALYSDLLSRTQGAVPEAFHVVTPDTARPEQTYRFAEYAAYYRLVRRRLEEFAQQHPAMLAGATYPEPVDSCDSCRWRWECDARRRADDHVALVAGVSRLQRQELEAVGVTTLASLGTLPLPLPFVPQRGHVDALVRVRHQARVQLEGRLRAQLVWERLPLDPERGLTQLPEASLGDVFLDLEGDPFAREGGREYLFGIVTLEPGGAMRRSLWATTDAEERAAFEATVDAILASWAANPAMHVYHYAPYEPAALKRLMGRHATRGSEVDRMLRAGLFVDLHDIARNTIRASVERYSIKDLEPFYRFSRSVPLEEARTALRLVERGLELGGFDQLVTPDVRVVVEGYNLDDCISAMALRNWLEQVRGQIEAEGVTVARPSPKNEAATAAVSERAARVAALVQALTFDVQPDPARRSDEEQARWLLAQLLDWHGRESKVSWWEYFRLCEASEEELVDEKAALAGLTFVERIPPTRRGLPTDRYTFPEQEADLQPGDELHLGDGTSLGKVDAFDSAARTVDIKKKAELLDVHPPAVFAHSQVKTDVLADALLARAGRRSPRHRRRRRVSRRSRVPSGEAAATPARLASEHAARELPGRGAPGRP